MLEVTAKGGDFVRRGAPGEQKLLEAGGQAGLLLRGNGESMAERVHDDARVGDDLEGLLTFLVAEA